MFCTFFSLRISEILSCCGVLHSRIHENLWETARHLWALISEIRRLAPRTRMCENNLGESQTKKVQDRPLMTSRGSWTEHVTKTHKMACSCIYNGWEKNTTLFKNNKLVYCYSSLKVKSIQIRSDLEYLLISINHRNVIKIDRQAKTLPLYQAISHNIATNSIVFVTSVWVGIEIRALSRWGCGQLYWTWRNRVTL